MLRDRFGESSGRPYVPARVFLPRLGLAGNVSFIFDTGADSSVLMPADAATLGVDYGLLSNPFESFGIGGSAPTYIERARIAFVDANAQRVYGYDIGLLIHHPTADAMRCRPCWAEMLSTVGARRTTSPFPSLLRKLSRQTPSFPAYPATWGAVLPAVRSILRLRCRSMRQAPH